MWICFNLMSTSRGHPDVVQKRFWGINYNILMLNDSKTFKFQLHDQIISRSSKALTGQRVCVIGEKQGLMFKTLSNMDREDDKWIQMNVFNRMLFTPIWITFMYYEIKDIAYLFTLNKAWRDAKTKCKMLTQIEWHLFYPI